MAHARFAAPVRVGCHAARGARVRGHGLPENDHPEPEGQEGVQRLAHLFEEISEMSDYREIACDGMVSLSEIMNRDDCDQQKNESDNERYRHERSEQF